MATPSQGDKRDTPTDTIVDLELNLFSQGQIRVAVTPIGDVPDEVFQLFMGQLHQYSHVKLKDVRANYDAMSDKNPFKSQPWNTGAMHFKFVHESTVTLSSVAHLDGSRAIMAVIGIFHCDTMPDVKKAEEALLRKRQLYQKARPTAQQPEMPHRLFGFEPADFDGQKGDTADTIVPFKRVSGELQLDPAFFAFIMHDFAGCMLVNLAGLATYQNWKEFQLDHFTDRAFQGGGALEMPRNNQDIIKRKWLRYYKRLGDLCLLAAAPADAVTHYNSALETGKALADNVMVGSVHEGLASACVLDAALRVGGGTQTHGLDRYDRSTFKYRLESRRLERHNSLDDPADADGPESTAVSSSHHSSANLHRESSINAINSAMMALLDEDEVVRMEVLGRVASDGFAGTLALWEELRSKAIVNDVKAHLAEARTCYKKKGAYPCLAALELKWARFLAGINLGGARLEVTHAVMEATSYIPMLMLPLDQQLVLADAASICGMVGAVRKRALLLAELTQMLSRNSWKSPVVAMHALCGLKLFQCSRTDRESYKPWLTDARITDEMIHAVTQQVSVPLEGWKFAFMDLLKNIANVAITNGLWIEAWQAASMLLRHFGLELTKFQQEEMSGVLDKLSVKLEGYPRWLAFKITGPPPLVKFCDFVPRPTHLRALVVDRRANGAGKDETFKYKVVQASRKGTEDGDVPPQEVWVEGEDGQVSVYILNPCSDAVITVTMSLAYEHHDLDGNVTDSKELADAKSAVVVAREFKVVVPAALNLRDRSTVEFQNKSKMTMKARTMATGRVYLTGVTFNRTVLYFQPWSRTLPGEEPGKHGLPSQQARREQARVKSEITLRREGITSAREPSMPPRPEVVVVPAQPLLVARVPVLQRDASQGGLKGGAARQSPLQPTTSAAAVAASADSTLSLTLFEGQACALPVVLENCSRLDIHGIHLGLEIEVAADKPLKMLAGHAMGQFTGVHATVERTALDDRSPVLPSARDATVTLRLTAGARSPLTRDCPVTLRITYWSDASQPRPGLVAALENPATHAIGRQFCLVLNVTVVPHVTISSISCTPSAPPPPAVAPSPAADAADEACPARNESGEASCSCAASSSMAVITVTVTRTGRPLRSILCVCDAPALERLLAACAAPGSAAAAAAFASICPPHEAKALAEADAARDLSVVLSKFDTLDMYTVARSGKPRARKPLAEQLRAGARHFASCVAVVWWLDPGEAALQRELLDNPAGAGSFGFVTISEHMLLEKPRPPSQGLPSLLRMPICCGIHPVLSCRPSTPGEPDTAQATAFQPVLLRGHIRNSLPAACWVRYAWRLSRVDEAPERASDGAASLKRPMLSPAGRKSFQDGWPLMRSVSRTRSYVVQADAKSADAQGASPRGRVSMHHDPRTALAALTLHDADGDQALDAPFFPNGIVGGDVLVAPEECGEGGASVELSGVFSMEGLYEARLAVKAVWEDGTGAKLAAEDFTSSAMHLIRVSV